MAERSYGGHTTEAWWVITVIDTPHGSGIWTSASGTMFPTYPPPHPGARFYRIDLTTEYVWNETAHSWEAPAGGASTVVVSEVDGVPSVTADTLVFDQADGFVVTDLGAGDARVDLSGVPEAAVTFSATGHDHTGGAAGNTIPTAGVEDNAVTYGKLQDVTAESRLLGRGQGGGAGDPQEIVLGTNLSMTGTTLNAAAAGGADVAAQTMALAALMGLGE